MKDKKASSLLLLLFLLHLFSPAVAADPDPAQDFCVGIPNDVATSVNGFPCKPDASVTSDDFFSTVLSVNLTTNNSMGAGVSFADAHSFPGLNTLGISMVRVDVAPAGLVTPHTHPRATELVFVTEGRLLVGFVATDGRYFSKVVGPGELFVIPIGLIHFQYNVGEVKAAATVAFGSQLPGTVLAARSLFGSKPAVPDVVLSEAFGVEKEVVREIRAKFG
ncbi:Germin-like protein 3-8 [Platanthera zijinensis]|uniref:Germin-like protein n=1 Tax=Platanthera zijinensis TaxID=2320716 RepID=A0AAP0AYD8_9ASPA